MTERLARRGEADLLRRLVYEMVRREGLDQPGLQVGAGAVDDDVRGLQVAAAHNDVDRAILAAILARRRGALGGRGQIRS